MAVITEVLKEKGSGVIGVEPTTTVYQAIEQMVENNCGSLLVMHDDDIAGIFTERDYLRKVALQGRTAHDTSVQEVMTSPVVVCETGTEIDEALAMMTDRRIRHLPVVDDEGDLLGIVTEADFLRLTVRLLA